MKLRFHVYKNKKRTTISMEDWLVRLIAIKLGVNSKDKPATRNKVQSWMQALIKKEGIKYSSYLSQFITRAAVLEVVEPKILDKWFDQLDT